MRIKQSLRGGIKEIGKAINYSDNYLRKQRIRIYEDDVTLTNIQELHVDDITVQMKNWLEKDSTNMNRFKKNRKKKFPQNDSIPWWDEMRLRYLTNGEFAHIPHVFKIYPRDKEVVQTSPLIGPIQRPYLNLGFFKNYKRTQIDACYYKLYMEELDFSQTTKSRLYCERSFFGKHELFEKGIYPYNNRSLGLPQLYELKAVAGNKACMNFFEKVDPSIINNYRDGVLTHFKCPLEKQQLAFTALASQVYVERARKKKYIQKFGKNIELYRKTKIQLSEIEDIFRTSKRKSRSSLIQDLRKDTLKKFKYIIPVLKSDFINYIKIAIEIKQKYQEKCLTQYEAMSFVEEILNLLPSPIKAEKLLQLKPMIQKFTELDEELKLNIEQFDRVFRHTKLLKIHKDEKDLPELSELFLLKKTFKNDINLLLTEFADLTEAYKCKPYIEKELRKIKKQKNILRNEWSAKKYAIILIKAQISDIVRERRGLNGQHCVAKLNTAECCYDNFQTLEFLNNYLLQTVRRLQKKLYDCNDERLKIQLSIQLIIRDKIYKFLLKLIIKQVHLVNTKLHFLKTKDKPEFLIKFQIIANICNDAFIHVKDLITPEMEKILLPRLEITMNGLRKRLQEIKIYKHKLKIEINTNKQRNRQQKLENVLNKQKVELDEMKLKYDFFRDDAFCRYIEYIDRNCLPYGMEIYKKGEEHNDRPVPCRRVKILLRNFFRTSMEDLRNKRYRFLTEDNYLRAKHVLRTRYLYHQIQLNAELLTIEMLQDKPHTPLKLYPYDVEEMEYYDGVVEEFANYFQNKILEKKEKNSRSYRSHSIGSLHSVKINEDEFAKIQINLEQKFPEFFKL